MTTLSLLQLVSPALPVGAFSYSEGLESLIQSGALKDEQEVEHWLNAELQQGALRFEAAALSHLAEDLLCWSTHADLDARNRIRDLNGWLLANREASMVRAQQRQMGGSLLQLMAEMGHPFPSLCPLLGRQLGLGPHCRFRCLNRRWLRATSTAGLPISSVRRCDCCHWDPRGLK